jgi:signal transduction histidine kinase
MNSLSYKIGLGYFTIIIFNILLAFFAIYHINSMTEPLDKILKENYRNIGSAENMKLAFTQQELTQLAMIEGSIDSVNQNRFTEYQHDFSGWQQQAYKEISLPAELVILDSLGNVYKNYLLYSDSLQKLIKTKIPYTTCKAFHYNNIFPIASRISALCNRLKEVNEQALFEADNKARAVSFNAQIIISVFAIIIICISIIAGIYFTNKIIKPLKMTTDSVRKIRKGQINQKVSITTNDEIAELGIEFNSMTDRMNKYLKEVSGLKELDRLKSDFMATISHEFKTPLTSINMVIDILQKEIKGSLNQDQKELLISAKEEVTRLNSFARDLLELSKLESGTKMFDFQPLFAEEVITSVLKSFSMLLKKKKINTDTMVDPMASRFVADKSQILRVLSNLIDNAIRYTQENGRIKINVQKQLQNIQFSVEDNGKGIAPEALDFIFEKFMQTENLTETNVGLGLAIAKEIVEQHQGQIWVESTQGKGSIFYFTIPAERTNEN